MRVVLIRRLRRYGPVEAVDHLHLLDELGLRCKQGKRGQWRSAIGSLKYKYNKLHIVPFNRDEERWGRYVLRESAVKGGFFR